MREEKFQEAVRLVGEKSIQEAVDILKEILEADLKDYIHYKALKLYADIIGPITNTDYIVAIDLYQSIINETEDDDLYESAQVSILNTYLNLSIQMMETFESTRDILESDNDKVLNFLKSLDEKREQFITQRAESIYKNRM